MRSRSAVAITGATLLATVLAAVVAGQSATRVALHRGENAAAAGFRNRTLSVRSASTDHITLARSADALLPGRYTVIGEGTRAELGPVLHEERVAGTVVRRISGRTGAPPMAGSRLALTPELYRGDPRSALGLDHADLEVPSTSGPLPCWLIPGPRDLWVIALHSLGTTREQPLNLLPFLHLHGFPVLLPTRRGDAGAPAGSNAPGADAVTDTEAVLRHALRYGAPRVVLLGWSAGAAMALHVAIASPLRSAIAGLVLDSPLLDPAATVRALAHEHRVPGPLVPLAAAMARHRPPVPSPPHGPPRRADGAPLPVLVFHSPDDPIAPWDFSRDLAARHPESVTLHTVRRAGHAAAWNADPAAYEETLRRFLTPLC